LPIGEAANAGLPAMKAKRIAIAIGCLLRMT
jgi:hypothetical protein